MRAIRFCIGLLYLALSTMLFAGMASAADPVKIRIGWVVAPGELQPILFAKEGIARHLGKSYLYEPIRFQGSPLMITAMAAGELDISAVGYTSLGLAILNANMTNLRIISDEFQDGIGDYYSNEYMVRNDSNIYRIEDLKGKVLVTNAIGSLVELPLRLMLRKNGMEDRRDFTIIEAAFPSMKAMLFDKKVDLIPAVLPFSADPELRKNARTLFTAKDAMGPTQTDTWAASAEFLAKNRAAMVDFMEDALRATKWYIDPKNHDEVVKIVSNYMKLPPERFSEWIFTKKDYYRDANLIPDIKALQSNVDVQRQLGFLNADLDISKYVDLSIVDEASARLK